MELLNILKRCQSGDREAFTILFECRSKQAFFTACLITGHREIADDIVQETFIQCFKSIHRLHNPVTFDTWFYRILYRVSCRMAAKETNRRQHEIKEDSVYESLSENVDIYTLYESRQLQKAVIESLNLLNPSTRMTVALHYFHGMPIKEIACTLNCFEGTVKSRLHSARKVIAQYLDAHGWRENRSATNNSKKESACNAKIQIT